MLDIFIRSDQLDKKITQQILNLQSNMKQTSEIDFIDNVHVLKKEIESLSDPFDKDELYLNLVSVLSKNGYFMEAVNIIEKMFDDETKIEAIDLISIPYKNINRDTIEKAMYKLIKVSEKFEKQNIIYAKEKIENLGSLNNIKKGKLNNEYVDTFIKKYLEIIASNKSESSYDNQCFTNAKGLLEIAKLFIKMNKYKEAYAVVRNESQFYCTNYNKSRDWCISSYIDELAQLYIQLDKQEKALQLYKKYSSCKMPKSVRTQLKNASFDIEETETEKINDYEERLNQLIQDDKHIDTFILFDKFYQDKSYSNPIKFHLLSGVFDNIIRNKKLFLELKDSELVKKYLDRLDSLSTLMKNKAFPFGQSFKVAHYYTAFGNRDKSNNILDVVFRNENTQEELQASRYAHSSLHGNYGSISSLLYKCYLENENIVKVMEIYNLVQDKYEKESIAQAVCEYYIGNKKFKRALKIIEITSHFSSSCLSKIIIEMLHEDNMEDALNILNQYKSELSSEDDEVFLVLSKKYILLKNSKNVIELIDNYDFSSETRALIFIELVKYHLAENTFDEIEDYLVKHINITNLSDFRNIYEIIEKSLAGISLKKVVNKILKELETIKFIENEEYDWEYDWKYDLVILYLKLNQVDLAIKFLQTLDDYSKRRSIFSVGCYLIDSNQVTKALELADSHETKKELTQYLTIHYAKNSNLQKVLETYENIKEYYTDINFSSKLIEECLNNFNISEIEKLLSVLNITYLSQDEKRQFFNYYIDNNLHDKIFYFIDQYEITDIELIGRFTEKIIDEDKLNTLEDKIDYLSSSEVKLTFYRIMIEKLVY